jgi:GR25 family glycosyltransferase involved in LPS biosynthesis
MFSIDGVVLANKGFYVNLDSSVNRKEHIENLTLKHNIVGLERFSALKDELVQSSCTKSHLGIFKQALEEDLEIIFVGEDDFDIKEYCYAPYSDSPVSFNESIIKISKDLENVEWDVLLFGCNPKSHLIPVTENLAKNYFSTGAWAYLIKKRAYKYILENSNYYRDYIAIDDYLPLLSKKGFVTLTTIPLTINHAIGFESTLQPRGPVNYDAWIQGSYGKFLYGNYKEKSFNSMSLEKQTTVVITGHYVENYFFYLSYLLHSLPDELLKCRFIVHYDEGHGHDSSTEKVRLNAFFRDYEKNINVTLSYGCGGLISSLESVMEQVTTPYFIF